MRDRIASFLSEVRDGFDGGSGMTWQDWLDRAQENNVAITIIFCAVLMVGSCVAMPVIAVVRAGNEMEEASAEAQAAQSSNPWSLDDPDGAKP